MYIYKNSYFLAIRYYIISRTGAQLDEKRIRWKGTSILEEPRWVLVKKGSHDVSLRTHDH